MQQSRRVFTNSKPEHLGRRGLQYTLTMEAGTNASDPGSTGMTSTLARRAAGVWPAVTPFGEISDPNLTWYRDSGDSSDEGEEGLSSLHLRGRKLRDSGKDAGRDNDNDCEGSPDAELFYEAIDRAIGTPLPLHLKKGAGKTSKRKRRFQLESGPSTTPLN